MVGVELTISIVAHAVRTRCAKAFYRITFKEGNFAPSSPHADVGDRADRACRHRVLWCQGQNRACCKAPVLIIDLTCHGKLGFNEDCPPEGD